MATSAALIFIYLAIFGLVVVGAWLVFAKAGEGGWQVLIPIWNVVVLLRIVGRPWWWILFFLVPLVGFVVHAMLAFDLAKSYGKGPGFALGLWLLPFVFVPILGFGGAAYHGPATAETWGSGSLF